MEHDFLVGFIFRIYYKVVSLSKIIFAKESSLFSNKDRSIEYKECSHFIPDTFRGSEILRPHGVDSVNGKYY